MVKNNRRKCSSINFSMLEHEEIQNDMRTLMFNGFSEYIHWLHKQFGHKIADCVRQHKLLQDDVEWTNIMKRAIFDKDKLKAMAHGNA